MELDLLADQFQEGPPFRTVCAKEKQRNVTILFPGVVQYTSEGRVTDLRCEEPYRAAILRVGCTSFREYGLRVWHLCPAPLPGEAFDEFDPMNLIHLYDGGSEGTNLGERVQLRLESGREIQWSRAGFLLREDDPAEPVAGTIELLLPSGEGASTNQGSAGCHAPAWKESQR